jgi:uncharacterized protein YuzE
MRIRIDQEADALYMPLGTSPIVESELVAPGIVLDYDAAGEVVGIEVLYLSRRSAMDLTQLLYENAPRAQAHTVRDEHGGLDERGRRPGRSVNRQPVPVTDPQSIVRTSEVLKVGGVYSRTNLRAMFDISAVTMESGVFKPTTHRSVWLFVTQKKQPEDTPYVDALAGDTLYWDGQERGRTDALIIEHAARGLELLLFYRRDVHEHPNRGFVYEGRFRYVSHTPGRPADRVPSKFVLKRVEAAE